MQMIAEIGMEDQRPSNSSKQPPPEVDDNFGMDDEDWEIYRGINKEAMSEDEEEDQQILTELEDKISEIDPSFQVYGVGSTVASEEDY